MKEVIIRLDTNDVDKILRDTEELFKNSSFEVAIESIEESSMSGHKVKEHYLKIMRRRSRNEN